MVGSGNANVVAASAGVTDPTESLGIPETTSILYTKIDKDEGDPEYLVIELTDVIPAGSSISIFWGSDDGNSATLQVQGTLTGTDYALGSDFFDTQTYTTLLDIQIDLQEIETYTVTNDTKYLRFIRVAGQGKPAINGVSYNFSVCKSAIPVTEEDNVIINSDLLMNIPVQDNDYDPQNLALTTSIVNGPSHGLVTVEIDGSITYVPNFTTFLGSDSFEYQICNTYNGGFCSVATTVTITGCAFDNFYSVTDSGFATTVFNSNSIDVGGAIAATGDPTTLPLTFARINGNDDFLILGLDQQINTGDKVFIYWASDDGNEAILQVEESVDGTNFSNLQTVTTTTQDPLFIISEYSITSTTQYLRFTRATDAQEPMIIGVTYEMYDCIDAYPIAVNDNVKINADPSINISVQANDSDPQNLALTTSIVNGPSYGAVTVEGDGSITYVPNITFPGTDSFEYQICNPYKPGLCASAIVTVTGCTVEDYYDVIGSGFASTVFDSNSIDVDGAIAATGDPTALPLTFARINGNNDFLILELDQQINSGDKVFIYWASDDGNTAILQVEESVDGTNFSNLQTVTTTIQDPAFIISEYSITSTAQYLRFTRATGAQEPMILGVIYEMYGCISALPVAVDDNAQTPANTLVNIDVQNNDSDPQNLNLTTSLTLASIPTNGTAVVQVDGTINYTPNAGYTGSDVFTYEICNTEGHCQVATVNVAIGYADLAITKTVNAAASYVEGDTVIYTVGVTNNGPDNATGIEIRDLIPINFDNAQTIFSMSQGSYAPLTGLWTVGDLTNTSAATLTITAVIQEGGAITNTASLVAINENDTNTENNTASTSIVVLKTFEAGSCIIDLSDNTSYNAGLKPYGLVYDLIENYRVPVNWAINPEKTFVNEDTKVDQLDFTIDGVDYYSGAFIISREFAILPEIQAVIATWATAGVIVRCNQPEFQAPIFSELTSMSRVALDLDNGLIAVKSFFDSDRAGISQFYDVADPNNSPYYLKEPVDLNACDDVYIMPHSDPHKWDQANKNAFQDYINNGGWLFAACHAVSSLEFYYDKDIPTAGTGQAMNLLSESGLRPWSDLFSLYANPPYTNLTSTDGTLPYKYRLGDGQNAPNLASDPIMQFLGEVDDALQGGSEAIYVPLEDGWRNTTTIAVWDPDHPDAPNYPNSVYPQDVAAAVAYGRAYGDPKLGMVLYEASHTFAADGINQNIAAARILGNFWLQSGIEYRPLITPTAIPEGIISDETETFSVTVDGQVANSTNFTYQWLSSCTGTFSAPDAASTSFTPDAVTDATECIIRLIVTDECGRQNFIAKAYMVYPSTDLGVVKMAPATAIVGETMAYEITVTNLGTEIGYETEVEDILPTGVTYDSYSASAGTFDGTIWSVGDLAVGGSATATITVVVDSNVASGTIIENTATVSSLSKPDLVPENDTSTASTAVTRAVDLELIKTVNNLTPTEGEDIIFTIEVTNKGPSDSSGFTVKDMLPSGFSFVSDNAGGNYNSTSGIWNFGILTAGQTATLNITATVLTSGNYTNYAQIESAIEIDPDSTPGNDSTTEDDDDTVTITPCPAATVSSSPLAICSGANAVFTILGTGTNIISYTINGGAVQTISLVAGTAVITVTGVISDTTIELTNVNSAMCNIALTGVTNTITVTPLPIVSITGATTICADGTTQLSPTTGGTWVSSDTDVATVNATTGLVTAVSDGTATFTFTNTTTNCVATTSVVTINTLPNIPVSGGDKNYCAGETIPTLAVFIDNLISVNWYSLASGGDLLASNTNNYAPTASGTYYAEAVNSSTGCISASRTAVTLTKYNAPTMLPQTQTICSGATAAEITIATAATWSSNILGFGDTGTTINAGILTNKGTQPYTVIVTAITAAGCEETASITVNPEPLISAPTKFIICDNGAVDFTINSFSPGTAINWELTENGPPITIIESGSGTDTISINKTGLASGNYTYTITGTKDGCTSSSLTIQVVVN